MSKTKASTTPAPDDVPPKSFEQAMAELEDILAQLESGQLALEEALVAYRRGSQLLKYCQKTLAGVQQQIQVLNENQMLEPYSYDAG